VTVKDPLGINDASGGREVKEKYHEINRTFFEEV
jgi:hypothetical protein